MRYRLLILLCIFLNADTIAQTPSATRITNVAEGWAGNSVNAVVFRKNSLVTFKDTQFIAFYNQDGEVVLGKRNVAGEAWTLKTTSFKGNIKDAHNSISIMTDGRGYLHVAWDHHNNPLNYARSTSPLSLELSAKMPMTGERETRVTYPEFHQLPNGNLLFMYRDGGSGNGNLLINKYNVVTEKWSRLQTNLIDGEGERNAYWQATVDKKGFIHLSWVWRESPDVASNHDLSYAVSKDEGSTWQKSNGEKYTLPITQRTAEIVATIPQKSELINQTSMTTNDKGEAFIASYWRGKNNVPQYQIVYRRHKKWKIADTGFRQNNFTLSGMGTKQIPISRPQIVASGKRRNTQVLLIFRDEERGKKVSLLTGYPLRKKQRWQVSDLTNFSLGSWEPSYDTELWKQHKKLHLFVQQVMQADAEGVNNVKPQMIRVLELEGKN